MLELREIMRSVCNITSIQMQGGRQGVAMGVGCFVAPDKVLTAWHVLQGKKDTVFTNSDGQKAKLTPAKGVRKAEHDLVLAFLDKPIGKELVIVPDPDSAAVAGFDKGFLLTRFNGAANPFNWTPSHHRVSINRDENIALQHAEYQVANAGPNLGAGLKVPCSFHSALDLSPGYSGSPVVDNEGRIMTVVSSVPVLNSGDYKNGAAPLFRKKNFFAPFARDTAEFLRNALG